MSLAEFWRDSSSQNLTNLTDSKFIFWLKWWKVIFSTSRFANHATWVLANVTFCFFRWNSGSLRWRSSPIGSFWRRSKRLRLAKWICPTFHHRSICKSWNFLWCHTLDRMAFDLSTNTPFIDDRSGQKPSCNLSIHENKQGTLTEGNAQYSWLPQ